MATLRLITEAEFRTSRYNQVADQYDGNLTDLIAQSEDYIENKLDRRLSSQSYVELHNPSGAKLFTRQYPVTAITTVKRRIDNDAAWTTLDNTKFLIVNDGRTGVIRSYDSEIAGYEIQLTYEAGYAQIPYDIKAAVILQTVVLAYQDLEVYGGGDAKNPGILYLQEQVADYLKSHQRIRML